MKKMVIYNGGSKSYYGCTSAECLVTGRIYEVIGQSDRGWQTDYTLKGVSGYFNSCWFDELTSKPTYYVTSHKRPVEGQKCVCSKLTSAGDFQQLITSTVLSVASIGSDTYRVLTKNSIYILTLMPL